MAFMHEIPYLGTLNYGASLRKKATRLESYAELNEMRGGTFGKDVLVPFFQYQLTQLTKNFGTPSDGPYLGVPGMDIRKECYHVLSDIRLHRAADKEAQFTAFCQWFINRWNPPVQTTVNGVTA